MQRVEIPDQNVRSFFQARSAAVDKAGELLSRPVIVAWKDDREGRYAPDIPGAMGDRWHVYGEHNDGVLELEVANDYHFIFTDAEGFEEPDLNLTTLEDNGMRFMCLNDACTDEDREKMGYFAGGGVGG
ncbi:MAG: AF1514 family protein [Gammaproteobacteria bacterium]